VVIHKVLLINKEKSNKKENIVVTVININSLNANLKDATEVDKRTNVDYQNYTSFSIENEQKII
jgi:hypothetical protein